MIVNESCIVIKPDTSYLVLLKIEHGYCVPSDDEVARIELSIKNKTKSLGAKQVEVLIVSGVDEIEFVEVDTESIKQKLSKWNIPKSPVPQSGG